MNLQKTDEPAGRSQQARSEPHRTVTARQARPNLRRSPRRAADIPRIKHWKLSLFRAYTRRYLKRHFHAVRMSGYPLLAADRPAVVYLNHASWWDPLIALFLGERLFRGRDSFGPIEARQLERYGVFRGLGFFGVEPGTTGGALTFLRTSRAVLSGGGNMLWLTPQGCFADPRKRPIKFLDGLGQLALQARHAVFLPLAIEYPFWQERRPEALVRFGAPLMGEELCSAIESGNPGSRFLESRLEQTQDELASAAQAQEPELFTTLIGGAAGVGGVYDCWRRFKALISGVRFQAEHRE
jgi:1-acyl-sn-glycerol-3-phosphate acyltransferase